MKPAPPPDLKPFFLTLDDLDAPIDWPRHFGNDNPVEVDIGCGRGMHLVNAALANPDVNYLGIEIDYRVGRHGAKRLKKREMPNARVLGGDVRVALEKYIKPSSVAAAHVYFPDPWWKKKHRRRRLFTDEFADQLAIVLQPGGLLHSWTDVEDYFEVISALLNHNDKFESLTPPPERESAHELDYTTSFERKKRKYGFPIHRGLWRRLPEIHL